VKNENIPIAYSLFGGGGDFAKFFENKIGKTFTTIWTYTIW
jgi:hypothetical protein